MQKEKLTILYEDNHIIAVIKPSGVLTQGDKSGDRNLMDMVKDMIKARDNKPGNVFLGLVHRLDKPVSGIVLFGKTSKGASRLSEQFRDHTIQKTYHAVVVGKLKESKGSITEKINKISFFAEGFTDKTDAELLEDIKKATKTRTAELSWEVVKENEKYSLVKIMPKTGRFHQIRVQMSGMGHPVLGDSKYDAKQKPLFDKSIALCATAITFKTATDETEVNLEIPLPELWDNFFEMA